MCAKSTTILRWTGRGGLADLQSSIEFVIADNRLKATVSSMGGCLAVQGPEPLGVAALFGRMPGVAWIAAGVTGRTIGELPEASGVLAKKYVRKSDRFSVEVEGIGKSPSSDLGGAVTSRILDAVKGSRVSASSPKVRFRAVIDGDAGVVGVEVKQGPGGVPTGKTSVACLVSGGIHSSLTAWRAMLLGFRVRLVHAKYSDVALRAVARLYSELSFRADPRWLSLEVLEGDSVVGALADYADRSKEPVFGGFTPPHEEHLRRLPKVRAPLYLTPEERFLAEFEELGIREDGMAEDWDRKGHGEPKVRRYGGKAADVSAVLDGLS